MNSVYNMVYISIESRKGGVGKTTTALTLAETLLKDGWQVLMFDMDIIGTRLDASFIQANKKLIHEVKRNGTAVNLIEVFKSVYMAGRNIPGFALEANNVHRSLTFEPDKCNYIGSNIYDSTNGTKLLEDPRILYDALHAFWLLEFVKAISESFAASSSNHKVAIILDNSPGLSSIENVIHDFITGLGPKKGKILLVSTIDPQDLNACRQSKQSIEDLFGDKVAAGKYYRSMSTIGDGEAKNTPAFNSVWNCLCASEGKYPEYHSENHKNESQYVSILVNKVPRNLYEQLFAKGLLHRESEEATSFQNHLLYYFSNPQLAANEIRHQQSYMDNDSRYMLSGDAVNIKDDDERYLELCRVSRQNGIGRFFDEEWAPMAHFRSLIEIMKNQEVLKASQDWEIILDKRDLADNSVANMIKVVEKYVRSNLSKDSRMEQVLADIVEYVTIVLNGIDGKTNVDFHPELPKLQEIGDFVNNFGLAAYRLHIYRQVCEILNMLIKFCLENVEHLEKVDRDSISSWVANFLEGRIVESNTADILSQMLNDHMNARELSNALKKIIMTWEL